MMDIHNCSWKFDCHECLDSGADGFVRLQNSTFCCSLSVSELEADITGVVFDRDRCDSFAENPSPDWNYGAEFEECDMKIACSTIVGVAAVVAVLTVVALLFPLFKFRARVGEPPHATGLGRETMRIVELNGSEEFRSGNIETISSPELTTTFDVRYPVRVWVEDEILKETTEGRANFLPSFRS